MTEVKELVPGGEGITVDKSNRCVGHYNASLTICNREIHDPNDTGVTMLEIGFSPVKKKPLFSHLFALFERFENLSLMDL